MAEHVYHLALAGDWEARAEDDYRVSTLGAMLEQHGFIHCSFRAQVQGVADLVYRGRDDVVLLEIDPQLLTAPLRAETGDGGGVFPHLYGPLNRSAVVRVAPVRRGDDGRLCVGL